MGAAGALLEAVDQASRNQTLAARTTIAGLLDQPGQSPILEAKCLAILAWTDYLDSRYTSAVITAERAMNVARESGQPEALLYALASRLLASAGTTWAGSDPQVDHFAEAWNLRGALRGLDPESRMIVGHMLVEAIFATGRLSEASELLDDLDELRARRSQTTEALNSALPFMIMQRARVQVFQGRMSEALPIVESVIANCLLSGDTLWATLAEGYLALIVAHRGEKTATREHVARMIATFPDPRSYLDSAVYAICAYALLVIGDTEWAAELAEIGGGDSELSNLQVADRGLSFELLVSAALKRGDLATAELWGARSISIAAHPAAASIVEQLLARIDLARGAALSSAEQARVSAARSRLTGRYVDAARSELLRARALASAGLRDTAIRQLIEVAHSANSEGLYSYGREAISELRLLGRRLSPVRGSGWSALSERERQVAVLAAEGFSNREIGETLFLSSRTVQSHISRALIALGVKSRSALPALVQRRLGPPRDDLPELTSRQWEVARLVAAGASNSAIGEDLSISVKTVEKHVSDILARWALSSRTGIATFVIAESRAVEG